MKSELFRKVAILITSGSLAGAVFLFGGNKDKVKICHYTGSDNNPYVYLVVPSSAVKQHQNHPNDIIGVNSEEDCKTTVHATVTSSIPTPDLEPSETYMPTASEEISTLAATETRTSVFPTKTLESQTAASNLTEILGSITTTPMANNITDTPMTITQTPSAITSVAQTSSTPTPTLSANPTKTKVFVTKSPHVMWSKTAHPIATTQTMVTIITLTIEATLDPNLSNQDLLNEIKLLTTELETAKGDLQIARDELEIAKQQALEGEIAIEELVKKEEKVKDLENRITVLTDKIAELSMVALQNQEDNNANEKKLLIVTIILGILGLVVQLFRKNIRRLFRKSKTKYTNLSIKSMDISSSLTRGSTTTLEIEVAPNEFCECTLIYATNRRKELIPQQAGKNGKISWPIIIPRHTKPGIWKISIKCLPSGETQDIEFNVI